MTKMKQVETGSKDDEEAYNQPVLTSAVRDGISAFIHRGENEKGPSGSKAVLKIDESTATFKKQLQNLSPFCQYLDPVVTFPFGILRRQFFLGPLSSHECEQNCLG